MPTAPVDDKGTEIFFTDSGVPAESKDYTTLVIIHGGAFNGNVFRKLIPDASGNNVRLVILNRREYSGSSKYTDAEIDDLVSGRKSFMEKLALEVTHFLLWFIQTYSIPRISNNGKSGGLAIMGWSIGSITSLTVLGQPEVIPETSYRTLEHYLREMILFDPPDTTFEYYDTFQPKPWDPTTFPRGISGYYTCTYDPDLSPNTMPRPNKTTSHPDKLPSVDNMTEEELISILEWPPAFRTDLPVLYGLPIRPVIKEQTIKALFDEPLAREILPELKVVFIGSELTAFPCVWGKLVYETMYMNSVNQGRRARPIRFITLQGVNHFAHWDDPEVFWEAIKNAIHQ